MIKIITTEDGSHSLFDEELNETYHSTRGARGESMHVFIREGLEHWLSGNQAEEIKILEIGLGTGLNAFLTTQFANQHNQKIHFTSLEPFPIEKEIYQNLNFFQSEEERGLLLKIHESDWEKESRISSNFILQKTTSKLEDFITSNSFHIIYFDAFAPSKQPEVWSLENLKKCYSLLEKGGVLTTYCAQGQFKRNLVEAGFKVETLHGAMGKKEMVRGIK
ncbi:tRNA U34 5-methylaminomethyl-2-thiouridine-forming methyltransferase MnmC [Ekhidna lutea]|uniref:tRNA U34 5-methylaminomethyl-2-thiouridine-forming methyltransferase MnmC n=1 Tax=Ekhidna lutea TaxID=447679 RepID=A0A239EFU7_EKHLU|nr:tRNA (5-methylaminomethyl-2-thiouridine)(34)-methyltransferase MnmD [Ekhidna lutea]SNS43497.1 tRNA U34 5-methylaminomethyl-2-thiouridine-forming methyltransferase MnmC [Ekhidna lutea]